MGDGQKRSEDTTSETISGFSAPSRAEMNQINEKQKDIDRHT